MSAEYEWIKDEQTMLWADLSEAIDDALNGVWSMQAANIALRIVQAARLVGPTHPYEVQWPLVQGEVYRAVLEVAGLPLHPILSDRSEMDRTDRMMKGCDRTQSAARYAATVCAIRSTREAAFIRDGS